MAHIPILKGGVGNVLAVLHLKNLKSLEKGLRAILLVFCILEEGLEQSRKIFPNIYLPIVNSFVYCVSSLLILLYNSQIFKQLTFCIEIS